MPKMRLTDRNVASLKPTEGRQVDYWDTVQEGLCLRVSYGGKKTWSIRYSVGKLRKRLKIGTYPTLSLADARQEVKLALADIFRGDNPAIKRSRVKEQISVKEMAETYIEEYAKKKKRSWAKDEAMIKRDVLPVIGNLGSKQVEQGHIKKILKRMDDRGVTTQANRVFEVVRGMFNWAAGETDDSGRKIYINTNPCTGLKKPHKEKVRERNLKTDEITTIWYKIENGDTDPDDRPVTMTEQTQTALKLLLFLGQRVGEIAHSEKKEIDWVESVWIIPGTRTKNGRSHRVPLPPAALALFKRALKIPTEWKTQCQTPYIFPSPVSNYDNPLGTKPISKTSLNHGLSRVLQFSNIEDVRPHDFRETVATQMAALGVPEVHIGAVLNHVRGNVTSAHYIQHCYELEKLAALKKWEKKLMQITARKAHNV